MPQTIAERFQIIQGNITQLQVEAIVNAANNELRPGGGVCGAIFAAAGYEQLKTACEQIGYCPTGEAVITPGFDLPVDWIIHTVGPIYQGKAEDAELLRQCYRSCMQFAGEERVRSLAFPLISTGSYGYPLREAIAIAVDEINAGLAQYPEIEQVYLVCYSQIDYQTAVQQVNR